MSSIHENPTSSGVNSIDPTQTDTAADNTKQSRFSAYVELTKMRISVMVLVTFVIAAVLSGPISLPVLLCAMIGMAAIAFSGNAMNMYIERYSDFLMKRTRSRPLPTHRLSATEVAMFGAISFGVGFGFLWTAVNWQTATVGVANWILYVLIYTPMKRRTWFNTEVGAVAGAMPVIMGCLATSQTISLIGWSLFGVLLLWQFPHFMAIAWKYREDYAAGGLKMLTVTDPTGKAAGDKAVVTAILTLFVSLLPLFSITSTVNAVVFVTGSIILGLWYLKHSMRFQRTLDDHTARKLLRVSLVYLPSYMLLLLLACLVNIPWPAFG